MSWGTVTIGGVVFRETWTLSDDGATVKITGQESHPPQTRAEVRARHRNVPGLLGATVPAVWTDKSLADGFFVVTEASSDLTDVAQGAYLTATWSMTLARVGPQRDVEFESRVPTIARATELTGQTPVFWHAPPPGTLDYYTGATVPTATVTREPRRRVTSSSTAASRPNVAPRWTCPARLHGRLAAGELRRDPARRHRHPGAVGVAGRQRAGADRRRRDAGLLGGGVEPDRGGWVSVKSFVPTVNGSR
jgi:hypothetical protein